MLKIENREILLRNFESWTEIPMLVLVFVMIVTLITPLVVHFSEETQLTFELIDWIIWAAFALDLSVRTFLAPKRIAYLRKNWIDIFVVILPIFRIFRIFRVARVFGALRLARIMALFGKFANEVKTVLSRHYLHYLLVILIVLVIIGTTLIYHFDIGNNMPNGIKNLSDALWMVVVTTTSGGFENIFPATQESRGVSIILILFGTIVVSYFTASLASYFTEKEQDKEQERLERKLDVLIEEVKKLKEEKKS